MNLLKRIEKLKKICEAAGDVKADIVDSTLAIGGINAGFVTAPLRNKAKVAYNALPELIALVEEMVELVKKIPSLCPRCGGAGKIAYLGYRNCNYPTCAEARRLISRFEGEKDGA